MLTSLHVEGFRGLQSLSVERLARINLFVGMNQSGKTSLLDAIQILLDRNHPRALNDCQARRDERFVLREHDDGSRTVAPRLDNLFHGARLRPGAAFTISATTPAPTSVAVSVESQAVTTLPRIRGDRSRPKQTEEWSRLALRIRHDRDAPGDLLPIPHDEATLRRFLHRGLPEDIVPPAPEDPLDFIDVTGLDPARLVELWSDVPLTPREHELVAALQILEPRLEGITVVQGIWPGSFDFLLKLRGLDERLNLGDMGEGFRRMLGLLLALPGTPRQEILIDEIDTGLHYSVLPPMWQLVLATARQRNLQLFATTHSWDCVAALAKLFQTDPSVEADVLLHRIDPGRDRVTTYQAHEIDVIMQHRIEVRG